MKPADAVVTNGAAIPYPPATNNFHYEIELVVALGSGGRDLAAEQARSHVFGYAAGNDLTRRDLQSAARKRGQPWDTSKGFDYLRACRRDPPGESRAPRARTHLARA